MTKRRKPYVKYETVEAGLNPHFPDYPWVTPGEYLRVLKAETGLPDVELAYDLSMDSGCDVGRPAVYLWRKERV